MTKRIIAAIVAASVLLFSVIFALIRELLADYLAGKANQWLATQMSSANIDSLVSLVTVLVPAALSGIAVFLILWVARQWWEPSKPKEATASASGGRQNPISIVEIREQTFKNTTIILDGHRYVSCTFENCTIQWDGGKFSIDAPKFVGSYGIASSNPVIVDTLGLLKGLNMMDKEVAVHRAKYKLPPQRES